MRSTWFKGVTGGSQKYICIYKLRNSGRDERKRERVDEWVKGLDEVTSGRKVDM